MSRVGGGVRWVVGEGVRWVVGEGVRWVVGEGVRWVVGAGVRRLGGADAREPPDPWRRGGAGTPPEWYQSDTTPGWGNAGTGP
ncbi:hypothetical protein FHU32_001192 [Corynebacterium bovis DSM 20582 = CIP 54.80]|uniref:Uncharacterized protein n=1 Tax=Corynebacterium bovis DSM 20582 = CIP 54.80 TaxID=927655 RepID=A0A8H9Y9T3_9CORY|nr:hypothetical protein [Corynebacterium bovis DSM 20582 = CIP 54.80]